MMSIRRVPGNLAAQARQVLTGDLEMQTLGQYQGDKSVQDRREAALEAVFALPLDHIRSYPGATSICNYLENSFTPLLEVEYANIWNAIGLQRPTTVSECWPLIKVVYTVLRTTNLPHDCDIDNVWDALCSTSSRTDMQDRTAKKPNDSCFVAIFSVLCWTTMSFQPISKWADFKDSPSLMVRRKPLHFNRLELRYATRPIPKIFRQFHRASPITRWRHTIGQIEEKDSATLELSYLNYSSLHKIAKINIVWVSDWASHLDFDVTKRQLFVFKFPTFCALSAVSAIETEAVPVLEGLLKKSCGVEDADMESHNTLQLHQEVLMSYRILFGQQSNTRQWAKKVLRRLKEEQPDEFDPLLSLLCTHSCDHKLRSLPAFFWPVTCRDINGMLQEESSYRSQDDFPLFGERLSKLQEFCHRQQPSELSDIWRDRRNPLQWYTFWAVLVVGGLSVLIGLLQLGVAVAQLGVSQPASRDGNCKCSIPAF